MTAHAVTVVPGLESLAALHERALPQKDNLCGPFWGALVLQAVGITESEGEAVDQEFIALRAGTRLPEGDGAAFVPRGASPRRDYRLAIPLGAEAAEFGTSAPALGRTIEKLSGGRLAVVPVAGPWEADRVLALVEDASTVAPRATLIANLRTGLLWGSRPNAATLLAHLGGAPVDPPSPDWDVGHFNTLLATVRGPGGSLVVVRDTYATLGWGGYHLQPPEAVAAGLERGDGSSGGVLCVCPAVEADALRERLEENGYALRDWTTGGATGGRRARRWRQT